MRRAGVIVAPGALLGLFGSVGGGRDEGPFRRGEDGRGS